MMHEFCSVLVDIEANGIKIDEKELERLRLEYEAEREELSRHLHKMAIDAMGNIPINFNSPDQMSALVFSREVINKKAWAECFNLGTEVRNAVKKKKHQKQYAKEVFARIVQKHTQVIYKKDSKNCSTCRGSGRISHTLKGGRQSAARYICPECSGEGYILALRRPMEVAGFKIIPQDSSWASSSGFSTDKETLLTIVESYADGPSKEFFTKMVRLSAIEYYLTSIVDAIRRNIRPDGLLHTNFMQTVTATGRLSSNNPNFHNQPRGTTFPVRKSIISRFPGGQIVEGDYEQLEYRAAVELAHDKNGLQDITNGVDAHARTARVLTDAGQRTTRQDAKSRTFKPLYGGITGTPAELAYFKWFLEHHNGIEEWHEELCREAIIHRCIVLPTGREYAFPYAKRYSSGAVSNGTQIKNYPVQGFATADIVPVACIRVDSLFRDNSLSSCIINEIHDSIAVDAHPDELDLVIKLLKQGMSEVHTLMEQRYGIKLIVPYGVEIKAGINWLDLKKVA